eukprot:GHVU01010536.1.p1 GENE.GHVU01010536.1~~GHVU01010536.1.p1  ORF type:complete len:251 (-),score=14.39 GHVU01010536.1:436-1113(-)
MPSDVFGIGMLIGNILARADPYHFEPLSSTTDDHPFTRWDISEAAKDLLEKCSRDASDRPSIDVVLRHRWLRPRIKKPRSGRSPRPSQHRWLRNEEGPIIWCRKESMMSEYGSTWVYRFMGVHEAIEGVLRHSRSLDDGRVIVTKADKRRVQGVPRPTNGQRASPQTIPNIYPVSSPAPITSRQNASALLLPRINTIRKPRSGRSPRPSQSGTPKRRKRYGRWYR